MKHGMEFGRRPKGEGFDDMPAEPTGDQPEEVFEEFEDGEEDEDEEVDFDRPSFKRDQIWSDYAEDLDYDQ